MSDESELLPCPWCGGEVKLIEGEESAYIQCREVKMHRALWFEGDNAAADEVREQWNRRAPHPPAADAVVEVKPLEWEKIEAIAKALKAEVHTWHGDAYMGIESEFDDRASQADPESSHPYKDEMREWFKSKGYDPDQLEDLRYNSIESYRIMARAALKAIYG